MTRSSFSRREFLGQSALAAGASLTAWPSLAADKRKSKRPRIAAIFTVLRLRSHAYNLSLIHT